MDHDIHHRTGLSRQSPHRLLQSWLAGTVVFCCVLAWSAVMLPAFTLEGKLEETKSQAEATESKIAENNKKQEVLTSKISEFTKKINEFDEPLRQLDAEIAALTARIEAGKKRLVELKAERKTIGQRLNRLEAELADAKFQLSQRLVNIYTDKTESKSSLLLSFGGGNFNEWMVKQGLIEKIAQSDHEIMTAVNDLKIEVTRQRERIRKIQQDTKSQVAQIEADERGVSAKRDEVRAKQAELEKVRSGKETYLGKLQENEQHLHEDLAALENASAALEAAIQQAAQTPTVIAGVPSGPSPAGLIWPVGGTVVSGFGPRWGRLHAGIDIAAPTGTPIYAAAAGVVTYNSVMSGYGNLVIVQHAGGLSTAYAHQSTIVAQYGSVVAQGALLGYVGCTGHCYGDHLHFETRVNGTAVDPMQYL